MGDIYKFFDSLDSVQDCCVSGSCFDDFIDLRNRHENLEIVTLRPVLLEDLFTVSCPDCTLFSVDSVMVDYLLLSVIPGIINYAVSLGFQFVEGEWLPGGPHFTLWKMMARKCKKVGQEKKRRNICNIVTILPEENAIVYTHFRLEEILISGDIQ